MACHCQVAVHVLLPLLLFLAGETRAMQEDAAEPLPFSEYLDADKQVLLRWGFDEILSNITIELCVNTTGWVGFGLSPNGDMIGADIVMGGVNTDGYYFGDYHGVGKKMPLLDSKQSYSLLSVTEANGKTTMRFKRSIKSCDVNDLPITERPIKVIYAYGLTDELAYHEQRRGTRELNLLNYIPRSIPSTSSYFDMTIVNFTIPDKNTHYECRVMEAPSFATKQHIYRVEPLIEHVDLVHHLVLYMCPRHVNTTFQEPCFTSKDDDVCFQVIAAWGVGGGDFEVPENVGLPIGGDEGDIFYRLEVHYNNPTLIAGRVDNSGLRLHYTSELREHDAGVLMAGLAVMQGYAIPPNATSFRTYGMCDTSVMKENSTDLQVFGAALHTHLAGRKVRVGHYRNGTQLGFMAMDEHYNFEFQQTKNFGKTQSLKKGDSLMVECTYETRDRTDFTWSGLSTQNEMCLAFLFYYPASSMSNCISFPLMETLPSAVGASNLDEAYQILSQKTWNEEAITDYEKTLKELPQLFLVGDSENNYYFSSGRLADMMASPTPECWRTPSGSGSGPAPGPSSSSHRLHMHWPLFTLLWALRYTW